MDRAVCIHGHFYQPPRENAWLEYIQVQNSARPFHDWNCRTTAECYRPNTAARILDSEGRIAAIRNNYGSINFDFGPTLLSWLESEAPETYRGILNADRESQSRFSGHGSAIAQAYNHMIMPLANRRDRLTQAIWGLQDFIHRFSRVPEAMWLPETAVDLATLEVLAERGIVYTVLAPHQAKRVRRIGAKVWKDLAPGTIDTTQAYRAPLPSGKSLTLFFYDGGLAHDIAFGELLNDGVNFAQRLMAPFDGHRTRAQLVHLAADGETYGHHHRFGEMGLAYALAEIDKQQGTRLTNYGEFLAKYPPANEVEIVENTSWSCAHGVERWRGDCGCNAGSHAGWHQRWRQPMREALDWLRDGMAERFERAGGDVLNDPWTARDDYIAVILDRSVESTNAFFEHNGRANLAPDRRIVALKLLEMQRHAQLMYTSCGWFFDDISGIETVQVLQYAARAIQLCRECCGKDFEPEFVERLKAAPGNNPEAADGRVVYEKYVRPSMVDATHLAANFASRFVSNPATAAVDSRIGEFQFELRRHTNAENGRLRLDLGGLRVLSCITGEASDFAVAALNTGDEQSCVGVRPAPLDGEADAGNDRLAAAAREGSVDNVKSAMAQVFEKRLFVWTDLLPDERRRFIDFAEAAAEAEACAVDSEINRRFGQLLLRLQKQSEPAPERLRAAAECDLRHSLEQRLRAEIVPTDELEPILAQARALGLSAGEAVVASAGAAINRAARRIEERPTDIESLAYCRKLVHVARSIATDVDVWLAQNIVFGLLHAPPPAGMAKADAWRQALGALADELSLAKPEVAAAPKP